MPKLIDNDHKSCQVVRRHWDGAAWAIAYYAPWFDVPDGSVR